MKSLLRSVLWAGVLMVTAVAPARAQQSPAAQLLDQTVAAMGGRDKLLGVGTLVYTGFGQDAYMDGGGNITAESNVPPKWRAIADAQRLADGFGHGGLALDGDGANLLDHRHGR